MSRKVKWILCIFLASTVYWSGDGRKSGGGLVLWYCTVLYCAVLYCTGGLVLWCGAAGAGWRLLVGGCSSVQASLHRLLGSLTSPATRTPAQVHTHNLGGKLVS